MAKISIIHPSRSRAKQAEQTYKLWMDNAANPDEIDYIFSIDNSDPQVLDYMQMRGARQNIVSDNKSAIEAINEGVKFAHADLFVVVSDDFGCPKDWDKDLLDALAGKEDFVVKTQDGSQPWIITLPILDRAYYRRFGWIYNPAYLHMFTDTEMTHLAHMLGRVITLPIKFRHHHYTQTDGQPQDEINKKNDSTWAQGEKVYLDRLKDNFGIENPLQVELPDHHKKWLKHKGIEA